jgi:pSer/pThr/pTyr-binding forkhead associated (FHA) protein
MLVLPGGVETPLSDALTIGRDESSTLRLDDATVSRDHAHVRFDHERWCIEDRGSLNGTFVNGTRLPAHVAQPLRHCDRIACGAVEFVFAQQALSADPDSTIELDEPLTTEVAALSAYQLQVVHCLCARWLSGDGLDVMPTNAEIAEELGTPEAEGAVKAALRRAYGKAGLTGLPAQAKRRQLCRVARQRGWI